MPSKSAKILITGLPGCGKTTAVMQILQKLKAVKAAGFYTQEIRKNNTRKGFRWAGLDGTEGILAHVDIKGPFRVGKYGVDVMGFEKFVVPVLDAEQNDAELFVIDEIGKMELASPAFKAMIIKALDSGIPTLATLRVSKNAFFETIRNRPDVYLIEAKLGNRNELSGRILNLLTEE